MSKVPKEAMLYIEGMMGRSPKTKITYESFANGFWDFLKGKKINDITADDVISFIKDGVQNKKWKSSTVKQKARLCRSFLYEFRDEAFMKDLKKQMRFLPKTSERTGLYEGLYVPPEKIDSFISYAEDEEWAVLYTMILKWGLRLSEGLSMTPASIDPIKNRVVVHGKGMGGMGKIRIVLVEKSTITRVLTFAGCSQEQILGQKPIRDNEPIIKNIRSRNAEYKWKETAKKTGLKNWTRLTPHDGRHSYAIDFLIRRKKEGMAALVLLKNQLGHTNITTTQIYLDIAGVEADDVFNAGYSNSIGGNIE